MKQVCAILIMAVISTACNKNQIPRDTGALQQAVDSRNYVFLAQTASPMGGRVVHLSHGYDLVIKPDSVVATLPYYGKVYVLDRNMGGIRFTSSDFDYRSIPNRHGGWDIVIMPRDAAGIQALTLAISPDGNAALHVNSNDRQSISFRGEVISR